MTHIPDFQPLPPNPPPLNHRLTVSVHWLVKERRGGRWVPVHDFHNLVTNYGLTAYAAAPAGAYLAPTYLVIEQSSVQMYATVSSGVTSIQITGNPTIGGDTQLVLSAGTAAQEVVTFTAITGSSSPYTVTLSAATVNTHTVGDLVVRQVTAADTMASVLSEAQYDPTFNANKRVAMTASYSPGLGQNTMQFFISGATATNLVFAHVGLADQVTIGNPLTNLHNYAALGYNHNNTNDVEIDVTYTLQTY